MTQNPPVLAATADEASNARSLTPPNCWQTSHSQQQCSVSQARKTSARARQGVTSTLQHPMRVGDSLSRPKLLEGMAVTIERLELIADQAFTAGDTKDRLESSQSRGRHPHQDLRRAPSVKTSRLQEPFAQPSHLASYMHHHDTFHSLQVHCHVSQDKGANRRRIGSSAGLTSQHSLRLTTAPNSIAATPSNGGCELRASRKAGKVTSTALQEPLLCIA